MMSRMAAVVSALTLVACVTDAPGESAYNKGVAAYRAKDYGQARRHWSRAIDEGEIHALNNLGYLLYYGLGGEADPGRAASLWRKGAAAGHSEAQWHLGRAFTDGKGVDKSDAEAYAWYRCALANAEAAAREEPEIENAIAQDVRRSIVILVDKLSPAQFEIAARLADQYLRSCVKGEKSK